MVVAVVAIICALLTIYSPYTWHLALGTARSFRT